MFHGGDLYSGIARALEEAKVVVCFVCDGSDESNAWEYARLQTSVVKSALEQRAVTLRIEAGSQEAGYLSAVCPVTQTPLVVVIHEGQLRETLPRGMPVDEFTSRLLGAVELPSTGAMDQSRSDASTLDHASVEQMPDGVPSATSMNATFYPETHAPTAVQNMLQERRARLEAEQEVQREKEKAAIIAKGKVRRLPEAGKSSKSVSETPVSSYAQQQKERLQAARDDRQRVLRRLEEDKIERHKRDQRRRELARAELTTKPKAPVSKPQASDTLCSLQVRLLDGSLIRHQFSAGDRLGMVVRQWIDQSRTDGSAPYNLKQILAPLPSRTLSASDEEQSLEELSLMPTATLVLSPVHNISTISSSSFIGRAGKSLSAIYSLILGAIHSVYHLLASMLHLRLLVAPLAEGEAAANGEVSKCTSDGCASASGGQLGANRSEIRIRTLRDDREDRDDQQLYNGNQLNFEPNARDNENADSWLE